MMESYTSQQGVEIITIYYRNTESVASTLRVLRTIYCRNNRPSRSTTECLSEVPVVSRILLPLRLQLKKAQNVSHTSFSSVGHRNDLDIHPYRNKLTQELKPLDHQKRRMFVNWAEQQLENDSKNHLQR